jgi:branched-chain amino acid transport system substrate-binding protein
LLGADGWDSADLDLSAVEGGYFSNHYSPQDPRPMVASFLANYQAAYGSAPDALAVLAYDATNVLLQAISDAGTTDTEKVRDTLAAIKYEGIAGEITYNAEGDPIKTAAINKVTLNGYEFVKFVAP